MNTLIRKKLFHLPLEPYRSRYTEFLHQWETRAFGKHFNITRIEPTGTPWVSMDINSGEVLDSVQRPVWAMGQVSELLKNAPHIGRVWVSDFFHPGLEALPYSRSEFQAYSFLWAQTFDQYDFTTRFVDWMRPWEVMAFNTYTRVFVASTLLKELIVAAIPGVADKIEVVGLPFDSKSTERRLTSLPAEREFDCVYSSRFDAEKNPSQFLDLVDRNPHLSFVICTGLPELRGTDVEAVKRAKRMCSEGKLIIRENCSKEDYYYVLASSKVQFNCARQDWVSFTLLEALTFGCWPLYPNFRSFPETLFYEQDYLYTPNDMAIATEKLLWLLQMQGGPNYKDLRQAVLDTHDGTLNRIAESIAND